ncbi:aminotransferase class V-fold PLP-dependent enzyme [Aquabacterium sp.]|uniref:aminotransferase class V-fold PLP-dependent enzyme n=1 Tax=Aquabacterium sp. TaxID=1872578 RepID=UPI0035B468C1
MRELHTDFVGLHTIWPGADGRPAARSYLDSAATTLAMGHALERRDRLLRHYGSPHTALNAASALCVEALKLAQATVLRFFGFPPDDYHCIFLGSGATGALNRAAAMLARLHRDRRGVALSMMEHHSNDLPHRAACESVCHVPLAANGALDLAALERALSGGRVGYVAITACSNVTGALTPLGDVADLVHRHGAHLLVDGSQIAVHRRLDAPGALDAFVFCGHKAYAPGTPGVLIMRKSLHDAAGPVELGGGMVRRVSEHAFEFAADPADRAHAGTPDVLGAFQIAMVLDRLDEHGFDRVIAHEQALTHRLLDQLRSMAGEVVLYGDPDPRQRVGVVSFNVRGLDHPVVAWALSSCFNITVRNGCFCAQPYVRELLGVGQDLDAVDAVDDASLLGLVRASIGVYTSAQDIDGLTQALRDIAARPDHYRRWFRSSEAHGRDRGREIARRQLDALCRLG